VSVTVVERPIWRRFVPRFFERAVAHVREGGHAAVVHGERRVEMLFGTEATGRITELGLWAILAIEQQRWRRVAEGPARGLARAFAQEDFIPVVLDWCERDAVHEGPTRTMALDCLACAACCHDANVIVGERDLARFRRIGRPELAKEPYVRRKRDGKLALRFLASGKCKHLGRGNACAVYEVRPDNCRAFLTGSEACLAAREDTLGYRDG
jgi:hypothetical protein